MRRVELRERTGDPAPPRPVPRGSASRIDGAPAAALRDRGGLGLRDAADRCGMSASHLSAIERGTANPSVAALQRITRAYDTTLVELTSSHASGRVVRRTERAVTTLGDGVRIEQLALRPGQLEPHLFVLEPGATSEGAYAHDGEEFLYVLAGAVTIWIGTTECHDLRVGDAAHLSLHPAAPLAQHRQRGDAPAMDQHTTDLLTDWNALRDGVPSVWARYTDLVIARGEGAWLETIDGDALPRLHERHRGHEHRPRPPAGRGRHRRPGGARHPPAAEHRVPPGRAGAPRPAAASLPESTTATPRTGSSCRTRAPRRSRRR